MPYALEITIGFFVVNLVLPLIPLVAGCLRQRFSDPPAETPPRPAREQERGLKAKDILEWEFEYARTTASEAMDQRQTMINFYLLIAGFVITGAITVGSQEDKTPPVIGAILLGLLCLIGWIYFLSLIRLRQAWRDSAQTMNQIKYYYIEHAEPTPPGLYKAFRWKQESLPKPEKMWTVFFYSCMLIGFLSSLSFMGGGALLILGRLCNPLTPVLFVPVGLGVLLFALHPLLYWAFLRSDRARFCRRRGRSPGPNALVDLQKERVRYRFGKLFRVVQARLRYRRSEGHPWSKVVTRVNFERGAAAGVLLHDPAQDVVVLVKQFRYPVYAALSPRERDQEAGRAWLLEVAAGIAEGGEAQAGVAERELLEEAGYGVSGDLHEIATVYPSPGGSSEVIHLYWAEVEVGVREGEGGGLVQEGEETEVVELPLEEALEMIGREIQDAKTILCLQYLKLRQLGIVS